MERGYRVALTYNLILAGDTTPANGDTQAQDPPDRLVFLLGHRYTERGLSWSRLKGADVARTLVNCSWNWLEAEVSFVDASTAA